MRLAAARSRPESAERRRAGLCASLVSAVSDAVRIVPIGFLEILEVIHRQWARLAEGRHVGAHIVDPEGLGVRLVGLAALKEQDVRFDPLRIEDAGR